MPIADTFDEFLGPIAAGASPALISPAAFSDIDSVARVLPATLAHNTFGFECRLGEDIPRADFLVLATASWGRDSLAGLHPTSALPARLMADPVWRRVQNFAARWADPSSPLYHAVDDVWLEFDIDGPAPTVPSVFFGPKSDAARVAHEPSVDGSLATAEKAIRLLSGGEPPPPMLDTLSDCFRALSPDEQVFQVGLMLSRGAEAIRLCIRLGPPERTMEYLAQVGWPGSEADLRDALRPVVHLVDFVCLNIDAGESVHPKIGLECYFDGNRQPKTEPRWGAFLDSLVLKDLCTPDKRDALLAYPGYVDENAGDISWPEALRQASQLLSGRSLSTFVRSLHHVKLVYKPGEPLEAKAYLAANYHWHTPGLQSSRRPHRKDP